MPNVDLVKIAKLVVLVAIVIGMLAYIAGVFSSGAAAGSAAIKQLRMIPEGVSWAPADVATKLFPILMGQTGEGEDYYYSRGAPDPGPVWNIITGTFGAAFVAACVVLLVKVILRIAGS